ncbi:efflux RND transporter periplasmic adaptor subunit [Lacisediminimonas sp.]|uniref:efflux RND transporter periplasmic adaptor subunit n=1 Tax=Lacisediminimonas sp. TaxID=3060582 RepID=UPI00271769FA|nr:efflux RND transporter periplasmic adaptor subunit [Lacisediminimonas sp.]MDO8299844.1 efflux RND transporter periplasmic adaptor subunit [Lacisediminimonas sp.]
MKKSNLDKKQLRAVIAIIVVGFLLGALILFISKSKTAGPTGAPSGPAQAAGHADVEHHGGNAGAGHTDGKQRGDTEHRGENAAKGPHGGTLFTEGDLGVEVTLAEAGGESRLGVWLFEKTKPLAPASAMVSATIVRPNGEKMEVAFAPNKDGLASTVPIAEPHMFEATIAVRRGKEVFVSTFNLEEGKVRLAEAQIKAAGITVQNAGPARIASSLQLPGEIKFNEDRTAHVVPRLSGVVEAVPATLGQLVKKGQVLAVIASTQLSEQRSELLSAQKRLALAQLTHNREKKLWEEKVSAEQDYLQAQQSLREAEIAAQNARQKLVALGAASETRGPLSRYELRAPFDGMVVEKHITLGEAVKEDANVFTISDLSMVWAEITVPAKDLNTVRVGERATINATTMDSKATGTISYVGALLGEQTRTAKARVTLPNPQMAWRPGLFVNVELVSSEADVPVTVSMDAIQSVKDKPTVFVRVAGGFFPQPVVTGRTNGKQVEIIKGLSAGIQYAAAGSFVIKSELGKGSATHQH